MILCSKCKTEIHAFNLQMVMLHDELWKQIWPNWKTDKFGQLSGALCINCIEEKLGRHIQASDLKRSRDNNNRIPVNTWFAQSRNLDY